MSAISIRDAILSDCETIAEFNIRLANETEDKQLDRATITAGVRRMLEDQSKGRYFVAVTPEDRVVGQVMFTCEWSDWRNGDFWWLQSVYVDREFRRQGIFRMLLNHLRSAARSSEDVVGLRLYVEKDNQAAKKTYAELGFDDPGYEVFEVEFE